MLIHKPDREESVEADDVRALLEERPEGGAGRRPSGKRVLVGSSIPNPNGDIHLGHLAGPFLSADVYARYRRMHGDSVYLLSGSDDFQSWTVAKAEKLSLSPAETAAKFSSAIQVSCKKAKVAVDHFHVPSVCESSVECAHDLVRKLHADGKMVAREVDSHFCKSCDRHLFDAWLSGGCPVCGAEAWGSSCETCGRPHDGANLIDPVCAVCGEKPVVERVTKLYFPLRQVQQELEAYYDSLETNPYQRSLWWKLVESGLPDLPASQITDWGVPVPLAGFEGQCISPWIQMAADHLASSLEMSRKLESREGWRGFWTADDSWAVQFCGPDTGWIFGILYPAVFLAYEPGFHPAVALIPCQYYQLEGRTFSTSKNHAIWIGELVDQSSADVVRFYCAYDAPEVEQTNFRVRQFADTVHRELIEGWQAWLHELGETISRSFGGSAPEGGAWAEEHHPFVERLERFIGDARSAYEPASFSPQRAARVLCQLVYEARRFGLAERYRSTASRMWEERRNGAALELAAARTLALLAQPLMPDFADALWRDLGYGRPISESGWEEAPGLVPGGQRVTLGGDYFPAVRHLVTEYEGRLQVAP